MARSSFFVEERRNWLSDKKVLGPFERPVHRYVNCPRPFDPTHSALASVVKDISGLKHGMIAIMDEYPTAISSGRIDKWEAAAKAYIELFAYNGRQMQPKLRANP